ncbi:glycosyl hydrolase family 18 (putative chitinase) [Tumebacillus sp. BK434]|uniref:stalk domain-containing protein n=1 Tax=Tumebacillus sp. BK434 TaxID=2512169 RepID=UPI0010D509C7|nr:stalk domain-containing protein [Tumebacillus sp. BK434]TCP52402.1 glycosyl hydrolase family 18 (putative chitinase) [Tumebacillus sp. BK434]
MKRFWVSLIAALALVVPGGLHMDRAEAVGMAMGAVTTPSVVLDGYNLPIDPKPILYKDRVMVPFRPLAEALGIKVEWEPKTSTVIADSNGKELRMQIGNKTAWVGGKAVQLDVAPFITEGRSLIPLRFFSEHAGAQVRWDDKSQTVLMESQERDLHTMVFYGLGSYGQKEYLPYFDEAAFTWSRLDRGGVLVTEESEYRWPQEGAGELLQEVQTAGVDTSLMVFSVNEYGELTKLLNDVSLQQRFANDLASLLVQKGIGGAYLDFEALAPTGAKDIALVRSQYAAFVQRVADALHQNGKQLTVVVAPLEHGWYRGYDYKALAASADALFIMAYSYVDDKLPQPLNKIDDDIRAAVKAVGPEKLILGINAYSETPQGVQQKIGLAKRYNLQGVGFWILRVFDDPFMDAIDAKLLLRPELN